MKIYEATLSLTNGVPIDRIELKLRLKDIILPHYIKVIYMDLKKNLEDILYNSPSTIDEKLNNYADFIKNKYGLRQVRFAHSFCDSHFKRKILLSVIEIIEGAEWERNNNIQYRITFEI